MDSILRYISYILEIVLSTYFLIECSSSNTWAMDPPEKTNRSVDEVLEQQDLSKLDHDHAQLHQITSEEDARIRRKVDCVVLPMVRS